MAASHAGIPAPWPARIPANLRHPQKGCYNRLFLVRNHAYAARSSSRSAGVFGDGSTPNMPLPDPSRRPAFLFGRYFRGVRVIIAEMLFGVTTLHTDPRRAETTQNGDPATTEEKSSEAPGPPSPDFDAFWKNYADWARYQLARGIPKDEVDDLLGEAYVRMHKHMGSMRDANAAPAYLKRVLLSLCYDYFRRQRRRGEMSDNLPNPNPGLETEVERQELIRHAKLHLETQPAERRLTFLLSREQDEMTIYYAPEGAETGLARPIGEALRLNPPDDLAKAREAYAQLAMSDPQIGTLLGIKPNHVGVIRYRVRTQLLREMGLQPGDGTSGKA